MKVLVLSDSHGNYSAVQRAVDLAAADRVIHLGDGWRDAQNLALLYPRLTIEQVPGNCDMGIDVPPERQITIEGHPILICHGHTLHVKTSLLTALICAKERGVEAVLFGHTHMPLVEYRDGVWLFNPGSIGESRRPSYGILSVEDGKLLPSIHRLT